MTLLPYDSQFYLIKEHSKGGFIRQHFLVNESLSDYQLHLQIAHEKAIVGKKVDLLPTLGNVNDELRKIIFPDSIFAKSPDLRIDGILWEIERSTNSLNLKNLSRSIRDGASQAHYVIVDISEYLNKHDMFRVVKGRFKTHEDLQVVELRYNGNYTVFERQKNRQL